MPPWLHAPKNGTAYKSKKKFVIPLLFPDVLQILFHCLPLSYVSNLLWAATLRWSSRLTVASFPESFRIQTLEVSLSLMVTSAPLWLLSITVSISKSPNRSFKSTIAGRSSISTRLGMYPLPAREFPRLLYFFPFRRRYWYRVPFLRLSSHIQRYIVSWETIANPSTLLRPLICSGL